ncbi:MAG TPA: diguanylate cyclase [Anaerolineales bacterium]
MFSFSRLEEEDLFQKYKRETYLVAFPFGIFIVLMFAFLEAETRGIRFFLALFLAAVLLVLTIIVWRVPRLLNFIEVIFYFVVVTNFFALTQFALNDLENNHALNLADLADQIYSLALWLVVFNLAAFLTLKRNPARSLIIYTVLASLVLAAHTLWYLISAGEFSFAFAFCWINFFSGFAVAILLIQRMGVLQQRHASMDALTGTLNRHAIYHTLSQEIERAHRYQKPFSIILFDLDLFKTVNDTYGHIAGDQVLIELTKLVSQSIRRTDSLGRWGGEEFLLILPETGLDAAYCLAERVRIIFENNSFVNAEHVTASFGVTTFHKDQSLEDMLRQVDRALYQAKNNGRNQVSAVN